MAARKRNVSPSKDNVIEKSRKEIKKAKRDINETSLATNKYGAILGIFILIFGIIYAALYGNYIYKRKTGQTTSALRHENPFANIGNINNLDIEAFRKAIKFDENGKITFSEEDMEKFKDAFADATANENAENAENADNAEVPPKENENIEEVGNENENENGESGAEAKAENEAADDTTKNE
ncbi:hypothetical protein BCR32DRAFT_251083 [Anaeromyces robustus]|uniref:Uncharacterized protein n=1 Tax=Anaeromyces robustus TaxID=1754192 RepID=A0A1Y1VU22_9FUNG|nr:hypothetical protein BCR32DRAFT_251083 [Anaeromyces robustus]|eukprot:ORX64516.1 hypothetical protein BCR32DRAFT_251083 [Anaeromyces robustus]